MGKYTMVVFDLDGVLVDSWSSWEFVHRHFGVNNENSLAAYIGGEIDDMEFMRRDIALWKAKKPDICVSDIHKILEKLPLMPGAREAVTELKKAGLVCAIISGGLDFVASRVGKELGMDYVYANGIECDSNGKLTGEGIPVVQLGAKDKALSKLLSETGIPAEKIAVIGDGLVDICMFEMAGLSIAFNARDNYTKEGADVVIEKKDLREILRYILE